MLSCNTALFLPHAGCLLQVRIEYDADNNTVTTSPLTAQVEHNMSSCKCVESVQLVARVTGLPSIPSNSARSVNV
jgi:hypothetical protein